MSAARALLLGLGLALVTPNRASADDANAQPGAPVAASDYESLIARGIEEFGLGHFEEARALFSKAHAQRPSARTLRGLGLVEFELRHYVRAERLLSAALVDERQPLNESLRSQTRDALLRVRELVGRVRVTTTPVEAQLSVDGEPVERDPENMVTLDPGERTVRVSHPGHVAVQRAIDVIGGRVSELQVTLEPEAAQDAASGDPERTDEASAAALPAAPDRDRTQGGGSGALPLVLASVGGAALVAGGVLGAMAIDRSSADASDSEADSASDLALGADVLVGVGFAALAGAVWLWLDDDGAERTASPAPVAVTLGPDAVGLEARGAF